MSLIWNRKTKDPLISHFLDKYGLHLLAQPRESVAVGDMYVHDQKTKQVSMLGEITEFYKPPLELPTVNAGERLADTAGVVSKSVSTKVGLGLLTVILKALGAIGFENSISASYKSRGTKGVKFRFAGATRDSLESILLMGRELVRRDLMHDLPLFENTYRYYLVSGVVRTPSISIIAEDEKSDSVYRVNLHLFPISNQVSKLQVKGKKGQR